ncbi:MAG: tetratricopeptide repeat protein [Cytophagaceae bacterium]|nr:tetratricopeptide repeat protein [Cytophagaceae bacterium]
MSKTSMNKLINRVLLIFSLVLLSLRPAAAQWWKDAADREKERSGGLLLKNMEVQHDATVAVNAMYNFDFVEADKEFRWLQSKYPNHPLPYFLFGLAEWWKIVPNSDNAMYDDKCLGYMDQSIQKAEAMYDEDGNDVEAAFFLAAANAFKGRLYAERKKWTKAALAGKTSLKYLEKSKNHADFSPELLFGDGIYNYYVEWIPANYSALKPILWFFHKGDKKLGIKQLEAVSANAFYTRTEAQYFLLQIYSMENQHEKAYQLARYLHQSYPNNPFFHRYLARTAFVTGRTNEAQEAAEKILQKIEARRPGYEPISGRYASFILAYYNQFVYRNFAVAKDNYRKAIGFAEQTGAKNSGYHVSSWLNLGKIAIAEGNFDEAKGYFEKVIEFADKKSSQREEAKKLLDENKKKQKTLKKEQRRAK